MGAENDGERGRRPGCCVAGVGEAVRVRQVRRFMPRVRKRWIDPLRCRI